MSWFWIKILNFWLVSRFKYKNLGGFWVVSQLVSNFKNPFWVVSPAKSLWVMSWVKSDLFETESNRIKNWVVLMSRYRKLLAGRTLEMNRLREVSSRQVRGKIVFHIVGPRTALRSAHMNTVQTHTRLGIGWVLRERLGSKRGKKCSVRLLS